MTDPGTPSPPSPPESGLERRMPGYRYGIVLGLLAVTYVFMASGPTGSWVPFVAVVLQGLTLLAALGASGAPKRLWRIAVVVVVIGVISATTVWLGGGDGATGILFVLNALLVAGAPVVIAMALVRRRVIDLQTVMGALCIYVLLGMLWAFVFGSIGEFSSGPFFAQQATATVADYLYFSFVTLTTVGYGDLTAALPVGRAIAVLEALVGQLYLVTVVALVVSRIGRSRRLLGRHEQDDRPPDA